MGKIVADINAMGPGADCTKVLARVEGTLLRVVMEHVIPPTNETIVVIKPNVTGVPLNQTALEAGPCVLKGLLTQLYGQKLGKRVATKLWTVLADSQSYNASRVAENVFDALAEVSSDAQ